MEWQRLSGELVHHPVLSGTILMHKHVVYTVHICVGGLLRWRGRRGVFRPVRFLMPIQNIHSSKGLAAYVTRIWLNNLMKHEIVPPQAVAAGKVFVAELAVKYQVRLLLLLLHLDLLRWQYLQLDLLRLHLHL